MNAVRGRTTAGTNTGSWAPEHRSEVDTDLTAVPLHECAGSDLPALSFTHLQPFDPDRIEAPRNDNWCKPSGGAWLSPYADDGRSHWETYIDQNRYTALDGSRPQDVNVCDEARVLVINSREDFLNAIEAHSYVYVSALNRDSDMDHRLLDFEAIAVTYDAVWITQAGVNANQIPARRNQPVLGPWDIPTVLVLNPHIIQASSGCVDGDLAHTSAS